ncbi:hypothetical protein [Bradyrhizobium neotropicale]|uniref:Helix-turn-helix domain-containing protein n=1 Tax=Bradyrhizobium neotropicale TaxID=1497615 RepID=A0A176ZDG3_9BRAD|nr:hypothetical protein [Bradyrhizobium neotropicale]OAF18670.1 hypothetical protein AXW67_03935 [Bradyrhizobium neotropicale]
MSTSKHRAEFFMRKLKWLDAIGLAVGKDHVTAHVAMIIAKHMNSDTGNTFVGRETIADLIGIHVRTVELSIKKIEALGFVHVQRARGRGHVNTYVLTFPEKTVSTPPFETEKAVSAPPFSGQEKAVSEDPKGGENDPKRRSLRRPNLSKINLEDNLRGNFEIRGAVAAAPTAPQRLSQAAPAPAFRPMSPPGPKTFKNRGEYEQRLVELITEAGGHGWEVVMDLDEVRVAALCRRLKNGVLTQQEINELCAPQRIAVVGGSRWPSTKLRAPEKGESVQKSVGHKWDSETV